MFVNIQHIFQFHNLTETVPTLYIDQSDVPNMAWLRSTLYLFTAIHFILIYYSFSKSSGAYFCGMCRPEFTDFHKHMRFFIKEHYLKLIFRNLNNLVGDLFGDISTLHKCCSHIMSFSQTVRWLMNRHLPIWEYHSPISYRPGGRHWPMTRHMSTLPCPPQAAQYLNRRLLSMTWHVPTQPCP